MKNLKKVLALGLALVMVLGMFTITASAAESKLTASQLTDWSSVSHKDAVALMVDLGIIDGIENADAKGTYAFKPTDTIDRASWAKMVYFAATGFDDADFYLGTNKTLKDITGNWAEAYISYLAADSVKIVAGDNEGNYKPDSEVSVAEAAKTLLVLLGYDPADRGYVNTASWAQNIITDAKTFGLMANVDKDQSAMAKLTRENAAEMVYNAMVTNTVKPSVQWDGGVEHITDYNKRETLGYKVFGAIAVEATVSNISENGYAEWSGANAFEPSFIKTSNLKEVKASADIVGEQAVVFVEVENAEWNYETGKIANADFVRVISESVAKSASTADKVITTGFVWNDVTTPGKSNYVANDWAEKPQFYINGQLDDGNEAALKSIVYNSLTGANRGPVVEFYIDNNGDIGLVKAYIHSVKQLTGDAETRTSGGKLQVRIPGLKGSWTDAEKVTGYQGLKKDDVVLYYEGPNDTMVIEKPEMVTGKVTAANSAGQVTVNGTRYSRTGLDMKDAKIKGKGILTPDGNVSNQTDFSAWANRDDEFNFYLDKSGAVCFTEQVTESISKSNIAIVLAAEWNGTNLDTASGTLRAKLLFSDGTTEVVTISRLDGKKVVTNLSSNPTEAAKEIKGGNNTDMNARPSGTAIAQLDADIESAFYSYRVVDGKYELTEAVKPADADKDDWNDTVSIKDGTAISKLSNFADPKVGYTADSKTVFIVAKGDADDKEFYTYTGFKNVPEMKSAKGMAIADMENANVARYVYLDTTSYSDDAPEGYVFIYNNKWEEDPDNEYSYLINIVDVNGEKTTMSVDETIKEAVAADTDNASKWNATNTYVGKFWKVSEISETGVVSELEAAEYAPADIEALGNEVVAVAGQSYDYDNITKFVYIDLVVDDKDLNNTADDDVLVLSACGEFEPDGFYDPEEIDADHEPGVDLIENATGTYSSVKMVMISQDGYTADFVYVVRVAW